MVVRLIRLSKIKPKDTYKSNNSYQRKNKPRKFAGYFRAPQASSSTSGFRVEISSKVSWISARFSEVTKRIR